MLASGNVAQPLRFVMKYTIEKTDDYALISLLEEHLDTRIAPSLKTEFVMMNSEGIRNIILDLKATRYIDSSGLSSILRGNHLCEEANGAFILCGLNDHVRKMIEIAHLDKVLHIAPSYENAIDTLSQLNNDAEEITTMAFAIQAAADDEDFVDDEDLEDDFDDDFDDEDFDDEDLEDLDETDLDEEENEEDNLAEDTDLDDEEDFDDDDDFDDDEDFDDEEDFDDDDDFDDDF